MTAHFARRPLFRWAALLVVAASGVGAWYALSGNHSTGGPQPAAGEPIPEPPPPDPRVTFDTPFRNVRPEVRYVGDAACAGCHAEIDKTYHAHPMGRSAVFVTATDPVERFDEAANNPCRVGPYELWVERAGRTVRHHVRAKGPDGRPLPDYVTTADLAIGSGTRGRSYLCIQDGEVWETPISWFGRTAGWDVSPGFDLGTGGRRAVGPGCLFCHVNRVEPLPGAVNRYREPVPTGPPAIGCERCHGPGELHVAERTAGAAAAGVDTSIVNPEHLPTELRAGVCAQCHLQGEVRVTRRGRDLGEFRPGLPLDLFQTTYVRHPDAADLLRSVGQFEQMHVSRCFTASNGALGCTSCHDPHSAPAAADRDRFYRSRCLACHGPGGRDCSERPAVRAAAADRCVACHMPRVGSSNIAHTSVTDHRIPRRPGQEAAGRGLAPGTIPIVPFALGRAGAPAAEEADRDLAIGLTRLIGRGVANDPAARAWLSTEADRQLRAAVARWPGDGPAWLALSHACAVGGDPDGAARAAAAALRLAPDSVDARAAVAQAALDRGDLEVAAAEATELVRLRPTALEPRLLRADVRLRAGDVGGAEADGRAALAIHPLHLGARLLLAVCQARSGDPAGGRRAAEVAAGLATSPRQKAAILEAFRTETAGR